MRGFRALLTSASGTMALLTAQPALSCPPPPPAPMLAGESQEDYFARLNRQAEARMASQRAARIAREQDLLATSDQVVVVRILRLQSAQNFARRMWDGTYERYLVGTMQVEQRLRGPRGRSRFDLNSYPPQTDCSYDYPISFSGLAEGDLMIVFARQGRLGVDTLIDVIREDEALDPATQAVFQQARAG